MSVKILTENLKDGVFLPLYYIYGDEEYLKQNYYNRLKEKSVTVMPEFNLSEFDNKSFDYLDFTNCVNSYPVMAEHKTVCVVDFDNSNLKKDFTKEFTLFLKNIPDYCTVVFIDTALKNITASNPLLKVIKSAGGIAVEVNHPDLSTLSAWAKRRFKAGGKIIDNSELNYLIDIADSDMLSLENEISKLCNYVLSENVTREDIDKLVTRSIDANRFEISDAFCNGDYTKVFDIVDKLYKQGVDDITIANVFYRTFLDMWKAVIALKAGKSSSDMARDFGMNPYGASKVMKNTRNVSSKFLNSAVMLSLKLDRELKSTPFNKRDLITMYIASLVDVKQNG